MTEIEVVGLTAGALTTFGFVPQIVRVYRAKSATEISLTFNLMFLAGVCTWLVYGLVLRLGPLIWWNLITLLLVLALLYGKLRYGMTRGKV